MQQYGPFWPEWLNADQAGAYLGIPAESVRELARRNILPGTKLRGLGKRGKLWRFSRARLDAYAAGGAPREGDSRIGANA
jgi:excisionase family DNA binding protein